jgi:hypothetical protein
LRLERVARDGLGANVDYDQVLLGYAHAHSWGANTVIGRLEGATTLDDDAPLEGLFQLGGFLRLSGFNEDELSGQHYGLATAVYMRRLLNVQLLRRLPRQPSWHAAELPTLPSTTLFSPEACCGFDTPMGRSTGLRAR